MNTDQPFVIDTNFKERVWQKKVFSRLKRFSVVVVHRRGGKTLLAIIQLVRRALKFKGQRGRFAYISPLLKQSKDIAWDYLKQYARMVPGTKINESELYVEFPDGHRIRLYGADNPDALRGSYYDGVVLDEVAQMDRSIWSEILIPALSDRKGWALFIGTAKGINLFSEIYHRALSDPEWYAERLTINDTDVFTEDEKGAIRKEMRSESEWQQEMMCSFDASSDNNLIRIEDVQEAIKRHIRINEYDFAPKIIGADVAWQNGDRCVIYPRQGRASFEPIVYQGLPEKDFAMKLGAAIDSWGADACFVDSTGGYGGEVISRLTDLGYPVHPVVFSWKASNERFMNIRAEMYFKMAEWIKTGCVCDNSQLVAELSAPIYSNDNASNRLKLESKDEIRKRLGVSPDLADALALTFAFDVHTRMEAGFARPETAKDYDPFSAERM